MNNDSDKRFTAMLAGFPNYIAICVSILLVVSVIKEYTYFYIMEAEFLTILTPTDYIKKSIYWIPAVLIFMSIGLAINYYNVKERFTLYELDYKNAQARYKWPDMAMNTIRWAILIIGAVSLPFIKLENIVFLQLPVFIIVTYFVAKLIEADVLPLTSRPAETLGFYILIFGLITNAPFSGLKDALRDINRTGPKAALNSTNYNGDIILISTIDRGVLFRVPSEKRLLFIPWDDVKLVKSEEVMIDNRYLYNMIYSKN